MRKFTFKVFLAPVKYGSIPWIKELILKNGINILAGIPVLMPIKLPLIQNSII